MSDRVEGLIMYLTGAGFKTSHFAQSRCQAQILILEILNVFLWLKFSPSLTVDRLERFKIGSRVVKLKRTEQFVFVYVRYPINKTITERR